MAYEHSTKPGTPEFSAWRKEMIMHHAGTGKQGKTPEARFAPMLRAYNEAVIKFSSAFRSMPTPIRAEVTNRVAIRGDFIAGVQKTIDDVYQYDYDSMLSDLGDLFKALCQASMDCALATQEIKEEYDYRRRKHQYKDDDEFEELLYWSKECAKASREFESIFDDMASTRSMAWASIPRKATRDTEISKAENDQLDKAIRSKNIKKNPDAPVFTMDELAELAELADTVYDGELKPTSNVGKAITSIGKTLARMAMVDALLPDASSPTTQKARNRAEARKEMKLKSKKEKQPLHAKKGKRRKR